MDVLNLIFKAYITPSYPSISLWAFMIIILYSILIFNIGLSKNEKNMILKTFRI